MNPNEHASGLIAPLLVSSVSFSKLKTQEDQGVEASLRLYESYELI